MEARNKSILFKLGSAIQNQHIGDLNLHFRKIRVRKCCFAVENKSTDLTRNLVVLLSGYNNNVSVADGGFAEVRPYFFSLPVGEGIFVTYLNVTNGGDTGTWDYETDKPKKLETFLEFKMLLDNVPFTPAPNKELILELEFSL